MIAHRWDKEEKDIYQLRMSQNIKPVYKMVDTCAAEFESTTPYYYGTYEYENESIVTDKEKILVLGSGPIRIGQGVELIMQLYMQYGLFKMLVTKLLL